MSYKIKFNWLKVSSVAIFLLFFQYGYSQSGYTALDALVAQNAKVLGTDVVLMVATKDTVVYQKSPKVFNARTQAEVGHTSQWLTAALLLVLVDEGKIDLDDKVSQYLPVFEKYGKNYITIRHCLTHYTGIQAESSKTAKLFEKKKFASLEDEVAAIAAKEIQTNPGTEFRYSAIGPAIAARVAEVVYKKKFDLLIQQKLLRPLGMRQTTFSTIDASPPDAATGARSTGNDFIRFLTMLLNNGTYKGQRILSEKSVSELRKIHAPVASIKSHPEPVTANAYAMGAWSPEYTNSNESVVIAGPSFGGTLPIVDFCRGYAFLLLVKEPTTDNKANLLTPVTAILNGIYKKDCPL